MQIFEIDEDHGAGTLIHSTLLPPSHAARQRRLSQYSYGQMSDTPDKPKISSPPAPTFTVSPAPEQEPTQSQPAQPEPVPTLSSSGGDHGTTRLQSPPTIPEVPSRSSRPLQTRPRINSFVNPSPSPASPLALLFQPIVVEEEEEAIADDHQDDDLNLMKPASLLSYGPASRRRLISIGPRRRGRTLAEKSSATSALNRWQQDTRRLSHSPNRSDEGDQFSRSPDPINPSTWSMPETAAQVLEEEETEGGEPGLSRRLEMMEQRQKRIEEMLMKLTEHLS